MSPIVFIVRDDRALMNARNKGYADILVSVGHIVYSSKHWRPGKISTKGVSIDASGKGLLPISAEASMLCSMGRYAGSGYYGLNVIDTFEFQECWSRYGASQPYDELIKQITT